MNAPYRYLNLADVRSAVVRCNFSGKLVNHIGNSKYLQACNLSVTARWARSQLVIDPNSHSRGRKFTIISIIKLVPDTLFNKLRRGLLISINLSCAATCLSAGPCSLNLFSFCYVNICKVNSLCTTVFSGPNQLSTRRFCQANISLAPIPLHARSLSRDKGIQVPQYQNEEIQAAVIAIILPCKAEASLGISGPPSFTSSLPYRAGAISFWV